ncbi:hypothetical protein ACLOJK_036969 [Asimina triloba]
MVLHHPHPRWQPWLPSVKLHRCLRLRLRPTPSTRRRSACCTAPINDPSRPQADVDHSNHPRKARLFRRRSQPHHLIIWIFMAHLKSLDPTVDHRRHHPEHFSSKPHLAVNSSKRRLFHHHRRQAAACTDPNRPSARQHLLNSTYIDPVDRLCPTPSPPPASPYELLLEHAATIVDAVDRPPTALPAHDVARCHLASLSMPPLRFIHSTLAMSTWTWHDHSSATPMADVVCIDGQSLLQYAPSLLQ